MNAITSLKSISFIFFISGAIIFSGCRDKVTKTFTANVPIYESMDVWRATTFQMQDPMAIENPGRIYIKGDYLLVNERFKGIHFINNSNPASPAMVGFLPIHANANMAVRGNVMYVDSYYDLLSFDISDPTNPQLVDRVEDAFEFDKVDAIFGYDYNLPMAEFYPEKGVVVGWEQKEITTDATRHGHQNVVAFDAMGFAESSTASVGLSNNAGVGGSMARFTLYNDYLYTLQDNSMTVYDVSAASNPEEANSLSISNQAETLFPAEGNLYVGTTTGMLIYSLANPSTPTFISEFVHVTTCDPVVVSGQTAYVTLSSGNRCWNNINRLDVIDLSDITNPTLIEEYEMTHPQGLGVDNNTLFLCDGDAGLKVFDVNNPNTIDQNMISHFPGINTYDVIPYNNVLIMVGSDGIFQYDYTDPTNIYQLSLIPVTSN
jgi:hypothetical protein